MHKTAAEMIIIVADPDLEIIVGDLDLKIIAGDPDLEIIVGNPDLSGHHCHIDVDDNQGLQK